MLDDFTLSYIECALWSTNDESTPNGGEPLDDNYGLDDISPECLATIKADCAKFQEENAEDIATWPNCGMSRAEQQAGHDFWLTRSGHGAGFWDGDWPIAGDRLTEASKKYGGFHIYVGDDGKIYC